ncbi:hypothetical protein BLA29_008592, partial [Euroglyphus maynei]
TAITTSSNYKNKVKNNKHPNRCISNPHNHQLIKANSVGGDAVSSTALVPIKDSLNNTNKIDLDNFRFSNEEIDRFRRHHQHENDDNNGSGNSNGDSVNMDGLSYTMDNRSTRATTPADEQIFQEPVESLQILLDRSTGQLIECERDLEINDIEPSSFLEFLRYAYMDSAKLNKDNVVGILIASKRYQVATLERQCMDYIHKCLSKRSSLAIWISTRIYGLTDLEQVARKSLQHYAESILLSN